MHYSDFLWRARTWDERRWKCNSAQTKRLLLGHVDACPSGKYDRETKLLPSLPKTSGPLSQDWTRAAAKSGQCMDAFISEGWPKRPPSIDQPGNRGRQAH